MEPEFLTFAEMKELDKLLNRYANLTDIELQRVDELHEKNEASLRPFGLDVLYEFLCRER